MAAAATSRPAWQTAELEDEWVDLDSADDDGTRSISFTAPIATHIHTPAAAPADDDTAPAAGTFLVRADVPAAPLLPKTPGKKGLIKDFFTPLPLERMFEPPSPPPAASSRTSSGATRVGPGSPDPAADTPDEIVATDVPGMRSFHGRRPSLDCRFTFAVPRAPPAPGAFLDPGRGAAPQATSTPGVSAQAPMTDPRLRLFQFQYDTFTREHLSALVDSIALNTPSAGSPTAAAPAPAARDTAHLRSTKRVKLSPRSDYGEGAGAGAHIGRPRPPAARDFVGEAGTLMRQIRQARDFSTISTVVSAQAQSPSAAGGSPAAPEDAEQDAGAPPARGLLAPRSESGSAPGSHGRPSAASIREQAAALMAQIKSDMKGAKRIFSGDTDASYATARDSRHISHHGDASQDARPHTDARSYADARSFADARARAHARTPSPSPARPHHHHHHRTASGKSSRSGASPRGKPRASPRRTLRRASADDAPAADARRTTEIAPDASEGTGTVRRASGPSYPSASVRADDLTRFVSSSTASGAGTTLTAGSAPSFVKHAGPAAATQMRRIGPGDVPALPERVGRMVFDRAGMRWVKGADGERSGRSGEEAGGEDTGGTDASEDPFRDISDIVTRTDADGGDTDDTAERAAAAVRAMSVIEEASEADDDEMELTSFSFDAGAGGASVMVGGGDGDATTDSDDDDEYAPAPAPAGAAFDSDDDFASETHSARDPASPARTPAAGSAAAVRSVLKGGSATPARTPGTAHRRSVSFSDGKRDGPIRGLREDGASVRSRRIAAMLGALEGDDDGDGAASDDGARGASPSRAGGAGATELQPLGARRGPGGGGRPAGRRVFSRAHASTPGDTHATFLTECSFGVAHDALVAVITDVQPFEPHWEGLRTIDLSGKGLESVARLQEFLPRLDVLRVNGNRLAWVSGVPKSVRTLSAAGNSLTSLTSFGHLLNLENLDVSQNGLDSLRQLACLRHLRELRADGNRIGAIDGLEDMDGLVKLSLAGNALRDLDLGATRWTRLEMLNVRGNALERVGGLEALPALAALNVDDNALAELAVPALPRLRILRASGNRLRTLDVGRAAGLRTLYADNNALAGVGGLRRLARLENVSVRNQRGRGLALAGRDVRDARRLYLSGNALGPGFLGEACYNLVYLELAACRLTALPAELGRLVPNLRVLNLNYNFIEDARGLAGLGRLRKLTMIGSRLAGTKALLRVLQGMPDAELLDFRMNPCTLGWYLPLLVRDVPGALAPGGGEWAELDSQFRRGLPDAAYLGRLAYRGLVMRACGRVRVLDGVAVTDKERAKAQRLLVGMLGP